jgi:hypothetical protein
VRSLTLAGVQFTGMYVTIQSASGTILAQGYTTLNFKGVSGTPYTVCVYNYGRAVFAHWGDGSTNPCKTVTLTSQLLMTAYYSVG